MKKIEEVLKCRVTGCKRDAKVHVHLLCNAHYLRYHRTGNPGEGHIRSRHFLPKYEGVKGIKM